MNRKIKIGTVKYLIFYRIGRTVNFEKGTLQEMQTRQIELQFEDIESTLVTGDKEQEIVKYLEQSGGQLCTNPQEIP